MRCRELGRTGLSVSEVGFGAEWVDGAEEDVVRDMVRAAVEGGVNIVDCWMSDPAVRSALGDALESTRERWVIQGHIGSTWQDGQYVRTRDLSQVKAAFEDLLARLRTDHVELGMIHFVDDPKEFDEIMAGEFYGYVEQLRDEGKIGHVGLSTHNPEVALAAARDGRIEMVMFSLNPAFDLLPASDNIEDLFAETYDEALKGMDPLRAELYATCERNGVGLTVMKGYAGGRLLEADKSPFGVALTPAQCIHYALTRPAVASVLVGTKTAGQMEEALAYETAGPEELDYASVLAGAPKHAYFGQCTYCGHCQPCTVGINIAVVNKYYDLAAMQERVPESVREHYRALPVTADACTGCEACESRCPFGVPIATRMAQAVELFG